MAKRDDDNELTGVDAYDLAEELADRMDLPPKDRATFLHECMTRCGFEPVQTREAYRKVQEADDDDGAEYSSRWGFGSARRANGGYRKRSSARAGGSYDPDKF